MHHKSDLILDLQTDKTLITRAEHTLMLYGIC